MRWSLFLLMRKVKNWLYCEKWNKKYASSLTQSHFLPKDILLPSEFSQIVIILCFSIIKSKNFRSRRCQVPIYYSTMEFHKNFTICFMNDSSYILMNLPALISFLPTFYRAKYAKADNQKWPDTSCTLFEERLTGISRGHYSHVWYQDCPSDSWVRSPLHAIHHSVNVFTPLL